MTGPIYTIVQKSDSWLMRAIGTFLKVVSFGQNTTFMTDFVTTINHTIYVPTAYSIWRQETRDAVIEHEKVHIAQADKYTFLFFAFLYVCMFFPIGLAYFRMKFEQEAYAVTLKCYYASYGAAYIQLPEVKASMVSYFTGPSYLWTWPFKKSIETWYDATVQGILASAVAPNKPSTGGLTIEC